MIDTFYLLDIVISLPVDEKPFGTMTGRLRELSVLRLVVRKVFSISLVDYIIICGRDALRSFACDDVDLLIWYT